jgi:hypothetical protein
LTSGANNLVPSYCSRPARRTLGYFRDRKFAARGITSRLREYGFREGEYRRFIVTWGWTEDAKREADA